MTLTQLRYFCEVSRTKNFTVASNNLFVAQSSVSFAIKELERELGAALFTRGKTVELTEQGEVFLPYVKDSLALLDNGVKEIHVHKEDTRKVHLATYPNLTYELLPSLLDGFYKNYTYNNIDVEVHCHHSTYNNLFTPLVNGDYDLIISGTKSTTPQSTSELIAYQMMKFFVRKDDPRFIGKTSVKFSDVADEELIIVHAGSSMERDITRGFRNSLDREPRLVFTDTFEAMCSMVTLKRKIGVSTTMPIESNVLKKLSVDEPEAQRKIYLSWANNRKLPANAAVLRDFIIQTSQERGLDNMIF